MKTLGIIGSGQLGRMLALAALPLGVRCRFLAQGDHSAVGAFSSLTLPAPPNATVSAAERDFVIGLDALTTEIENVDAGLLARLGAACPLWPPRAAIACKRDRREERRLLARLGLPQGAWVATPDVAPTAGAADAVAVRAHLAAAVAEVGLPCRVKSAVGGYDGRGQWRLARAGDVDSVDVRAAPFVVEAEVAFDAEFSLIGVFAGAGVAARCWTPAVNQHRAGILVRSEVTEALVAPSLVRQAEQILNALGHALGYCGVLALELYRVGERVLINEFAPRVHNSGHWTIEGAACSQFENHVRAVLGLPLGDTALRAPCVSWNVIGQWPERAALLAVPGLHVHDYEKQPRAGRKLGHVTLWGARPGDARAPVVESLLASVGAG